MIALLVMSDSEDDGAASTENPITLGYNAELGVTGAEPCDVVTDLTDLEKVGLLSR